MSGLRKFTLSFQGRVPKWREGLRGIRARMVCVGVFWGEWQRRKGGAGVRRNEIR